MRFTLRSLLIAAAIGPPLLAALWLEPAYMLAVLCYFAVLASIMPVAVYLWRNGPTR